LPDLGINEGMETEDATFDEMGYFRRFLPDYTCVTPISFSLMMYSFLDCEAKQSYGAGKKKTIETVFKYSRRIIDSMKAVDESSSDNEDDSDGEEIKESFKRKRKAVYQKKFDTNDNNQKTDRNYA
jgi:hypothetical protein